ncbi:MAG: hypothetical protein NTY11_01740 [Candidatus Parcubacteria bacterium]|nr:hypothetical protein [Candidatus Parcubacteria bacterium]
MSPEIVKKPSTLGPVFLVIPLIIVVVFMISYQSSNNQNTENNKIDCVVSKVNAGELASLSARKIAEEINQKPLCKDVCLEQIKYSKVFSDWQASNDMRNICKGIGLPLPIK